MFRSRAARRLTAGHLLLGTLVSLFLAASPKLASADDKATCLAAASKGQRLRDTHKFVEARDQLRICAAAACPGVVQGDCATWLADVERAIPTVVITARDGAGASLVDVTVTADGQPLSSTLDGQAIVIDPGAHLLHFQTRTGTTLDQQIVVTEGEKNQHVAVVLGSPAPDPSVHPGAKPADADAHESHAGGAPWKTIGLVVGGVGVAGLIVGTIFGVVATNDNNSAHCNASHQCEPGPLSDARSAAVGADVGLIAGGVLLAGGAALVIFGPSASGNGKDHAVATLRPMIERSGGGLMLGGVW